MSRGKTSKKRNRKKKMYNSKKTLGKKNTIIHIILLINRNLVKNYYIWL